MSRVADVNAERLIVATLLAHPSPGAIAALAEGLRPDDFSDPRLGDLWRRMVAIEDVAKVVDIEAALLDIGLAPGVGTIAPGDLLGIVQAHAMVHESVPGSVKRVRELARMRRLRETALGIIQRVDDTSDTAEEVQTFAEGELLNIGRIEDGKGLRHWGEAMDRKLDEIRRRAEEGEPGDALPTGLVDLDRKLGGGLRPRKLTIVAARPAVGKSVAGMQIAIEAAKRGVGAVIFSLEMDAEQFAERAIAAEGHVDSGRMRTGEVGDHDNMRRIVTAYGDLRGLPVYIDDAPGKTVPQIRSALRRLKAIHPEIGLVVVDYLQLMYGTGGPKQSRENVVAEVARGLHEVGKELDVRMVALAQLNRDLERRADKRPMMADLRESGEIEQAADTIVFLYRDELYDEESLEKGVAEWIIGKQRGGETGTVKVAFIGNEQRFANLAAPDNVVCYPGRGSDRYADEDDR